MQHIISRDPQPLTKRINGIPVLSPTIKMVSVGELQLIEAYGEADTGLGGIVKTDDLVMTKHERDRFEREYRIGAYAGAMPDMAKETDIRRLQRALCAIAHGLARSNPKWQYGTSPNVKNIVELALGGVSDEEGNTPRGFGKSTLSDTIAKALEACRDELDQ